MELRRLPGSAAVQVEVLFLALIGVEGHAAAPVGRGFLQDIALCALDDIPGRRTAVLGGHADCLEAVVLHGQDTAGVDAALHVGQVVHLIRLTEQAHDIADVVDIQIHQGTARTLRVKGDRRFPGTEGIVAAGILAEIALHQLHPANAGQQLPDLVVVFEVLGGHGLKQEHLFAAGQRRQLLGLGSGAGHGLFHNDMLARFQRHLGIAVMLQVGHGQIDHIHPLQ